MTNTPPTREATRAVRLLGAITDAYQRMATNSDPLYRATQMHKCRLWLDELTEIHRHTPEVWIDMVTQ